ncbi:unnamed protein product [Gordionus sp. m RMFG-2023]
MRRRQMDAKEFLKSSQMMSEYIVKYLENIHIRPVIPDVEPGFLKHLIPLEAPNEAENWENIMSDVEYKIMPGITHWQHPGFFAYFPAGNSYPSILADMLSDAIGCVGFSWAASPSCTELETIILDWLAKMLHLPQHFLYHLPGSTGGGVLQGSASECILVSMLTARNQALESLKQKYPEECGGVLLNKLVAYCSNQAHSAAHKASIISFVNLRGLKTDDEFALRGHELEKAIQEDIKNGFFPFMVLATLGSTSCCSFDNIREIGEISQKHGMWFHIDAAYAGSAFVCPEFLPYLDGVEYADSFNTNPNKWMLTNFDCSAYWIKNRDILINTLSENPVYLQHKNSDKAEAIDYRHWGIPLSRRFRALKLWFVIRSYGLSGIQKYIRNHVNLAKLFESLVRNDPRFEICGKVVLGLVCFRLKGHNAINKRLLELLNNTGKIHMVPASLCIVSKSEDEHIITSDNTPNNNLNDLYEKQDVFVLRFAICKENAQPDEITSAWKLIQMMASFILKRRTTMKDEILGISEPNTRILETLRYCANTENLTEQLKIDHFVNSELKDHMHAHNKFHNKTKNQMEGRYFVSNHMNSKFSPTRSKNFFENNTKNGIKSTTDMCDKVSVSNLPNKRIYDSRGVVEFNDIIKRILLTPKLSFKKFLELESQQKIIHKSQIKAPKSQKSMQKLLRIRRSSSTDSLSPSLAPDDEVIFANDLNDLDEILINSDDINLRNDLGLRRDSVVTRKVSQYQPCVGDVTLCHANSHPGVRDISEKGISTLNRSQDDDMIKYPIEFKKRGKSASLDIGINKDNIYMLRNHLNELLLKLKQI